MFTSTTGKNIVSVQNITRSGCQIAVRSIGSIDAYLAVTSGAAAKTAASVLTGFTFVSEPINIVAIYDGGVNV